jgi:hypothetical protein
MVYIYAIKINNGVYIIISFPYIYDFPKHGKLIMVYIYAIINFHRIYIKLTTFARVIAQFKLDLAEIQEVR